MWVCTPTRKTAGVSFCWSYSKTRLGDAQAQNGLAEHTLIDDNEEESADRFPHVLLLTMGCIQYLRLFCRLSSFNRIIIFSSLELLVSRQTRDTEVSGTNNSRFIKQRLRQHWREESPGKRAGSGKVLCGLSESDSVFVFPRGSGGSWGACRQWRTSAGEN